MLDLLGRGAALAQLQQLLLQGLQAGDPRLHVLDVRVDQLVDAGAVLLRAVAQVEQAADFVEGHVQAAAIANKGQALAMLWAVQPVIAVTAGRRRQ